MWNISEFKHFLFQNSWNTKVPVLVLANNHWSDWHTSHPPNSTYIHFFLAICTSAAVQCILVHSFSLPSFLPPNNLTWSRALNTSNVLSSTSYIYYIHVYILNTGYYFRNLIMHLISTTIITNMYTIRGFILNKISNNNNTKLVR